MDPRPPQPGPGDDRPGEATPGSDTVSPGGRPPPRAGWQGWAPQHPATGSPPRPQRRSDDPLPPASAGVPPPVPNSPLEQRGLPEPPAAPVLPPPRRSRRQVRELVETLLLAALIFLSVRASFQNFRVQGHSMYPTLEDGQLVVVSPLLYKRVDTGALDDFLPLVSLPDGRRDVFMSPSRGDIVVFRAPNEGGIDLVKRVIALPGETVQIIDGAVYIDDRRLEEPYIKQEWSGDLPRTFLPADYYFVLGDNRNNSEDSRSPRVGLVARGDIVGKALLRWWPVDAIGSPSQAPGELTDDPPPPPRAPSQSGTPAPASR